MKVILTCLLFVASFGYAQDSIVLGHSTKLFSTVLNEERTLNVYLPEGYHPDSSKAYPVIFLLDGSTNEDFIHVVGTVQFMTMARMIAPTVVVGIANVDRKRDFTFPTTIEKDQQQFPTTGHSANFISFLEKECIPYVEKHYKVTDQRFLIGQSLGGLLATEIVAKNPTLFSHYLIVSPSLWWDNQSLLKAFDQKTERYKELNTAVYIAVGKEGHVMVRDAKTLSKKLKPQLPLINHGFQYFPDEDHATILHIAVYEGLKWVYANVSIEQ